MIAGDQFINHDHPHFSDETVRVGYVCLCVGIAFVAVLPPAWTAMSVLYSKFSESKLSFAVMGIFRSFAGILPSLVYVASDALKCS